MSIVVHFVEVQGSTHSALLKRFVIVWRNAKQRIHCLQGDALRLWDDYAVLDEYPKGTFAEIFTEPNEDEHSSQETSEDDVCPEAVRANSHHHRWYGANNNEVEEPLCGCSHRDIQAAQT